MDRKYSLKGLSKIIGASAFAGFACYFCHEDFACFKGVSEEHIYSDIMVGLTSVIMYFDGLCDLNIGLRRIEKKRVV